MDAQDMADSLHQRCLDVLTASGHLPCDWSNRARYDPEAAAVICGCGEFADMTPPADTRQVATAGTVPAVAKDPIESTLALIDPTEHYTPADVERHILDVLARLETGALFERKTIQAHYEAKTEFERAYWRALDSSEATSADRRKADAMVRCEDLHLALVQAEMLKDAAKATMHNLRAVLSGYQSTSRSVGAAYQGGGAAGGHR